LLLAASTLVACYEGPTVTTEDEASAQSNVTPSTDALGAPTGPEPRLESPTLAEDEIDPAEVADDVKEPAPTTTSDSDDDTTTTSEAAPDEAAPDDGSNPTEPPPEDSDDDGDNSGGGEPGDDPPTPPAPPAGSTGLAATSVDYANDRRSEADLGALAGDPDLTEMADRWARQMAADQDLRHNPNLGAEMPDGYSVIGENIAYSSNPASIDDMWWESEGHRANILGESYTHIGVAFVEDDQGTTWAVQVFAG
jgi:uncharacterized protein YkwD